MSDISAVKALVFDVFGTVVDWRTSLIADFSKWSEDRGIKADWTALVDGWRAVYAASMDEVRKHPERGYVILDQLHRQSLEKLVAQLGISGLTDADLQKMPAAQVKEMPPAQVLVLYLSHLYHEKRDSFFKATYLPYPEARPLIQAVMKA